MTPTEYDKSLDSFDGFPSPADDAEEARQDQYEVNWLLGMVLVLGVALWTGLWWLVTTLKALLWP